MKHSAEYYIEHLEMEPHVEGGYFKECLLEKEERNLWSSMGCRTGFYLLLAGDLSSKDIVPLMVEMFEFIRDYKGEVPGASPKDCGNYLDMNLGMANYLAKRYLDNVLYNIDDSRLVYPE